MMMMNMHLILVLGNTQSFNAKDCFDNYNWTGLWGVVTSLELHIYSLDYFLKMEQIADYEEAKDLFI